MYRLRAKKAHRERRELYNFLALATRAYIIYSRERREHISLLALAVFPSHQPSIVASLLTHAFPPSQVLPRVRF